MADHFHYSFPAIRGVQAGRIFYVSMCPLRLLPKLFVWDDAEMPPQLRAQRTLNKGRIPEIVRYIDENPTPYTFSAITASVDASVKFDSSRETSDLGTLHIPMGGRFIINDGQHRRAAIEQALRTNPALGDETIAVVFFLDRGLERCQQMFADLNRHAVRPSPSVGILYDHRDKLSAVTKLVAYQSPVLDGVVELVASSLPKASRQMFTLSAIHGVHRALFAGLMTLGREEMVDNAMALWAAADPQFPHWAQIRTGQVHAQTIRRDYIDTHAIVLAALGRVGNTLLLEGAPLKTWRNRLAGLAKIDWSRSNGLAWEGRALVGGTVQKGGSNVLLTTALMRSHLGMALPAEEQNAEDNRKAQS
jgi:DNA sulfur modification protein DndB